MPFVSITRLRVRSWRFLPVFLVDAVLSARQAASSDGNLAALLLWESHLTFWTSTAWTDESAMRSFMLAGVHRKVMRKLLDWCDEASVVHWMQDDATLPDWNEAHRRLLSEGRRSKVHHPTAAHTAHVLPPPGPSRLGERRYR